MKNSLSITALMFGACLLSLSFSGLAADEPAKPSKIIEHLYIHNLDEAIAEQKRKRPDAGPRDILTINQTNGFEADPKDGPIWIMLNYIGWVKNDSSDGITSFEVMPEAIQVPAMDSFMLFESKHMADFKKSKALSVSIGGKQIILTESVLKAIMTKEQFSLYTRLYNSETPPLQLIQLKRYAFDKPESTRALITMNKLENMRAGSLEVVVGQGAVPPALLNLMEARNGSWFYRYRDFMLMLLAAAAFYFFVVRRLFAR